MRSEYIKTITDCVTVIPSSNLVILYLLIVWEGTFKICRGGGKRRVKVRLPPEKMRSLLVGEY